MNNGFVAITGASSGIGRALAIEFAKHGFYLHLIGRDQAALEEVEDECHHYTTKTAVDVVDLSDPVAVDNLCGELEGTEILVNNAGFGIKGDFSGTDLNDELRMLDVQLAAMLKLTKAVLPGMIERGRGRILNIASVYSYSPRPQTIRLQRYKGVHSLVFVRT